MNTVTKARLLQNRRWRIRKKVTGTAARPRLAVRSPRSTSTPRRSTTTPARRSCFSRSLDPELRKQKLKANIASAKTLGVAFAAKAKAAGISSVVFDRSGAPYHGKVKTFADAAREGGLQF
jgi:large subunit ribosomal protein L18